ncbi:hypothetical protein GALMADRAFT_236338 [Galerina marginata CBS 339.88]|uniref:Uncharacterized protein n=1 Tax=Galerina marginata (strain CBS 339.88) TaxID=685588 RepID=A0A067TNH2_GALM3|nr:hypothetical protein GALMADRAFT_236338 [Galerina marginata CBS 339.88]
MPTSELSDALNPYASQARQRSSNTDYSQPTNSISYQAVVNPPQQHIPHVSELQLAITEPTPAPARSRQGAQVVTELFRRIAATQHAHEAEQKRRLAWEQEQETKYTQKQAEMEKTMLEMANELAMLRETVNTLNSQPPATHGLLTPQYSMSPTLSQQTSADTPLTSPVSPFCQPQPSYTQPMFIQGSSNQPFPLANSTVNYHIQANPIQTVAQPLSVHPPVEVTPQGPIEPVVQAITPNPSPQLASVESSRRPARTSSSGPQKRKKKKTSYVSEDGNSSSCSDSTSKPSRPKKRTSHHDTRCYTIHHAVRLHILEMMDVDSDKELPDSHAEGTQLDPSEPIRFVWDKTTKQSVHNARMKAQVLQDIKENIHRYKNVPSKDFLKKNLDAAFEQCFVTFRQKYKVQKDEVAATRLKRREDGKARTARHLSRRKIKLNNRAEARNKIGTFEHVIFDGALQLDCMSSEESDYEIDPHSLQTSAYLKTHGYGWRSTRLLRFYYALDDEGRIESSTKPKRGVGRKERRIGLDKEEFILPPPGVATWMISRRWYKASVATHPDLPNPLSKLIDDPVGFDWTRFHALGEESADEEPAPALQIHMYNPQMRSLDLSVPQQNYSAGTYMNYTL